MPFRAPSSSRRKIRVVVTTIAAIIACTSADEPASTRQEDMVAVSRMLVTLDRLAAEGDVAGLLEYISDDAVFMPPDANTIVGSRQIGAWFGEFFDDFNVEMSHAPLETDVFGSIIIHRGDASGTLQPKNGAATIAFDNKYLFVIRKQADDSLKIWRAIFNNNPGHPE